jgi:hypothetical protein
MASKTKQLVHLTCECGMPYTLDSRDHIGRKCVNCGAEPKAKDPNDRGKYHMSIENLMEALKLGKDGQKELEAAKSISAKVQSPYAVSILVTKTSRGDRS